MKLKVFYQKEMCFPFRDIYPNLNADNILETHVELKEVEVTESTAIEVSLEDVFVRMQGEHWSPRGEAKELLVEKGLSHTSMSVGDVVKTESGVLYICEPVRWRKIETKKEDGKVSEISIKTGSEGPSHDPYSFTEYSVTTTIGKSYTLHLGLAEWIKENGVLITTNGNLVETFIRLTGLDPLAAEEEHNNPKCKDHPDADIESMAGYPGETFAVCSVCKAVLQSYFNENAIM